MKIEIDVSEEQVWTAFQFLYSRGMEGTQAQIENCLRWWATHGIKKVEDATLAWMNGDSSPG